VQLPALHSAVLTMAVIHVLRLLALLLDPRPLCSFDYRILERDGSFFQMTARDKVACADALECADAAQMPDNVFCRVRVVVGDFEYVQPYGGGPLVVIPVGAP
jgi:hypothetical protein